LISSLFNHSTKLNHPNNTDKTQLETLK